MRCYSEREIKRMVKREAIAMDRAHTSAVSSPVRESLDKESLEIVQLAADLEFELKFRQLMLSINRRSPSF